MIDPIPKEFASSVEIVMDPKSRGRRLRSCGWVFALLACIGFALPASAAPPLGVVPSYCHPTNAGYRCIVGPFDVKSNERVEIMTGVAAPSEAGYMTSGRARLVDGAGENVGRHEVHLHHAVWLNPYERDMTCESYDDGFPAYERFFATGKELTRFDLPEGFGYHWDPQVSQSHTQSAPWWALVAHLDGMHGASDVYIRFDLGFVPEDDAGELIEVRPAWFDVRNCDSDPVYTVRKGSGRAGVHVERWAYEMKQPGRFVFFAGHLHDGGIKISLRNSTSGEQVTTSRATYGLEGEPWYLTSMSSWADRDGISVEAGDRLVLESVYDSSRTWPDVMGIMVGAFVPKE